MWHSLFICLVQYLRVSVNFYLHNQHYLCLLHYCPAEFNNESCFYQMWWMWCECDCMYYFLSIAEKHQMLSHMGYARQCGSLLKFLKLIHYPVHFLITWSTEGDTSRFTYSWHQLKLSQADILRNSLWLISRTELYKSCKLHNVDRIHQQSWTPTASSINNTFTFVIFISKSSRWQNELQNLFSLCYCCCGMSDHYWR